MASKKRKTARSVRRKSKRFAWRATKGLAKGGWWITRKTGKGLWWATRYVADEERLARTYHRIRTRTLAKLDQRKWISKSSDGYQWRCYGCGQGGSFDSARYHVCMIGPPVAPPPRSAPAATARPATRSSAPTKGASIVPGHSAAARFAYLSDALPETVGEWEQLCHDLFSGVLLLANEIAGLAEDADIDGRVKDALIRLSDATSELAEPARDVRAVFRDTYGTIIDAMTSGVRMPNNPKFFEDAG